MELPKEISELIDCKTNLIGGTITAWKSFPPTPPVVGTITDITHKTLVGTDYIDVAIETSGFTSVVEGGPVPLFKAFSFSAHPLPATVVKVGQGFWVIAVPWGDGGAGVAVLQQKNLNW